MRSEAHDIVADRSGIHPAKVVVPVVLLVLLTALAVVALGQMLGWANTWDLLLAILRRPIRHPGW